MEVMGTMRSSITNVERLRYKNGLVNTLLYGWMAFAVKESPSYMYMHTYIRQRASSTKWSGHRVSLRRVSRGSL